MGLTCVRETNVNFKDSEDVDVVIDYIKADIYASEDEGIVYEKLSYDYQYSEDMTDEEIEAAGEVDDDMIKEYIEDCYGSEIYANSDINLDEESRWDDERMGL